MGFDLRNELTELDKKRITNYITSFGESGRPLPESRFIGTEKYLENWASAKTRLYRFLGKKISISMPIEIERNVERDVRALIDNNRFILDFRNFLWDIYNENNKEELYDNQMAVVQLLNLADKFRYQTLQTFIDNKINFNVRYKRNVKPTTLQIQEGMKPIKAIQKCLTFFNASNDLMDKFEEFRKRHSVIFNDKTIKCNLTISIHPLDFLTMSDNNSNWESCMTWVNGGCYHTGTVEMMNSNNIVCAFLESKDPFSFGEILKEKKLPSQKGEEWEWNNKRWRQLFCINKDIIVSGKSYPYYNEKLTQKILAILRDLAKENFHWEYKYGIERYQDMKYIYSLNRMNENRRWVKSGETNRKNIVFDTKIMYNDMLNDSKYKYWCVRNVPKKPKIISYSGKANCVCCNSTLQIETERPEYNERYFNTKDTICMDCQELYSCPRCDRIMDKIYHFKISYRGFNGLTYKRYCKTCYKENIRICPFCNKNNIFMTESDFACLKFDDSYDPYSHPLYKSKLAKSLEEYMEQKAIKSWYYYGLFIPMCWECFSQKTLKIGDIIFKKYDNGASFYPIIISDGVVDISSVTDDAPFLIKNLKIPEPELVTTDPNIRLDEKNMSFEISHITYCSSEIF